MPSPMTWPPWLVATKCLALSLPNAAKEFTPDSENSRRVPEPAK